MLDQPAYVAASPAAIAPVLSRWRQQAGDFGVLLLLPEAEQACVAELQAVFRGQGVPVLGAIFPALVTDQGFATAGAWLIGFAPMPPWFLLDDLNAGPLAAQARIDQAVRDTGTPLGGERAPTLFMIFDAMVPNIGTILDGTYRALHHAVRYAGVNAGSETFQPMHCLFDSESLVARGLAGLLLADSPVVVQHGYPVARTRMQAISTTGNRISLINQRPAFEVYQEVINAEFGVTLTRENFYDYAVHYPFGLIMAAEVVVRIPVGFEDDGSIVCAGELPPNSVLRLIAAPALADSRCVDSIAKRLAARPRGPDDTLLTFYCAGRRMHLGAAAAEELQQLRGATGAAHLAGALSLGEIDTLDEYGTPVFHNAALVCLDPESRAGSAR